MNVVTAVYQDGHLKLTSAVDWPNGTPVEVRPIELATERGSWFALSPLDVGTFCELTSDDDLLGEMLDDPRD